MKHIGIVDITTIGACLCANTIVETAALIDSSGTHPEFTLHAFPFKQYIDIINRKDWVELAKLILKSIEKLRLCGADFIIIPSNTPHFGIEYIHKYSPLPVMSIIDITADECVKQGFKKVAVLGTKFTMQGELYTKALQARQIEAITLKVEDIEQIHHLIIEEIIPSQVKASSIQSVANVINELECDAVILACTELPYVFDSKNLSIPFIDTTRLLAKKALEHAIMAPNPSVTRPMMARL